MSDKTYAETQGEAPFDWRQALENPELHDPLELAKRSGLWVLCACGNQCAIIPRYDPTGDGFEGSPIDNLLNALGVEFHAHVMFQAWEDAKHTLDKIEARSAILIAEELAKRNGLAYADAAPQQSE